VTAPDNERLDRWRRATDGPLLLLAAAFLVVLLIPLYIADLTRPERSVLRTANVLLYVAFGVDYLVRLRVADDRRAYVRGHIPDLLLLVVPFLRPLRLLRVIGLLGSASRRAGERQLARTLSYVTVGVTVLVVVAGGLVLDAERGAKGANITTAGDALWWASTTVSTVGYGDRYPVTGSGRLVAVALMVGGIALLGVVTASVAAWFVKRFTVLDELEVDVAQDITMTATAFAELSERLERIERALEWGARPR
jgi:voltage-gated potassium channel